MERLGNYNKRTGISVAALRTWGMMFLAAGIIGRGVIQNHILGIVGMDAQQMLAVMESSADAMNYVTVSLVLQVMEACAVPIFAVLLVEGIQHTSDFVRYFIRVLGLAVLTEIPYNLAMGTGILDFSSRNPVFGLVLGMMMIWLYQRYAQSGFKNALIKVIVTLAAMLWTKMLSIEFGAPTILVLVALWSFRKKHLKRNFAGATAAIACGLFSPFFLSSPMAFLPIHMCNWEKGEENRLLNYLMYPGMLLLATVAAMKLF